MIAGPRKPSIRARTLAMLLTTAGLGILATAMVFFAFLVQSSRRSAWQELGSLDQLIAYNVAPLVAFEDPESGAKLLEGLRQRRDITRAQVLRRDGSLFQAYARDRSPLPALGSGDRRLGLHATGGRLLAACLIPSGDGHALGTFILESDQANFHQQLGWALGTLIGTVLILGAGTLLLSFRLQRILTEPLLDLAGVAEAVSRYQDYGLRAERQGTRELDTLAEAFNGMLGKIQEQDGQLAAQLDQLAFELQERKQAETALRGSEQRYRSLVENTRDGMFWLRVEADGSFRVEDINPALEEALGLRRTEVIGRDITEFLPIDQAEAALGHYRECLQVGGPIDYEEQSVTTTGRVVAHTTLLPLADEQGVLIRIVGTSRNITQQRIAEEAFRQSQKLESLGVLAGGIAHDFNNLLAAIMGNLNLAQDAVPEDSPVARYLGKIDRTVNRAADLTRQMLAYSGRGRFDVQPLDLNAIVLEIGNLLSVSISKSATLEFDLSAGLPPIMADAAQIQQVVMNLVTNASDAIGEREGHIRLRTRLTELDSRTIEKSYPTQPVSPGPHLLLEVRDTGSGMSEAVVKRIFDPFYTTKPKGRGLGMSAILGILNGHKGGIHITSQPGNGSTFRLLFPVSSQGVPAAAPVQAPDANPRTGRILLVDDEDEVREPAAHYLRGQGYVVVEAHDGLDALDRFQPGAFDLVVMDLTMPRMNGRQAFAELRTRDAEVPVILCSGYDRENFTGGFTKAAPEGFLQKPYSFAVLGGKVAEVLMTRVGPRT